VRRGPISLEDLPCPLCGDALERGAGRQGLVWICRTCHGGAVTLPILRKFAPRAFVNALWQTALHRGRRSALDCPACTQPFTEVGSDGTAGIRACVRCYWVWLDVDALDALTAAGGSRELPGPPRALQGPPTSRERHAMRVLEGRPKLAVEDRR
jgi:Zn-finger nucleic acid-binding protein